MGTTNGTGQSEDLFSTNSFVKHPRLSTASVLHNYPQRLGEKDCAYYMLTRTCKFGANCKFNHPAWVPEGGIPSWKEASRSDVFPERPGEPDCPYTAQRCTFGSRCKFNHPKITADASAGGVVGEVSAGLGQAVIPSQANILPLGVLYAANLVPKVDPFLAQSSIASGQTTYPQRPGEHNCDHYMKFGHCNYGERCKFHHPIELSVPPSREQNVKLTLAGLPERQGAEACPFYMKTGVCKFGARCKFDHPLGPLPGDATAVAPVQGNAAGIAKV